MTIDPDFASPAEWARLYRARGVQVVPAFMPGENKSWKRPLLQSWTEFQEALVPDEVFNSWYGPGGQYIARCNMGVICGRCSDNLFVVDLDIHKKPAAGDWWRGLLAVHNNGMELETVTQRTGGGGLQKLFRAPRQWTAPTNKTAIGVDIRGQGGFAMMAPSMHESGHAYDWLEGCSPDEIEIAFAPDWLLEEVLAVVRTHGGVGAGHSGTKAAGTNAERQAGAFDAFGRQTDGREEYMRDLIWAAVVDWRRERADFPDDQQQRLRAAEKYVIYEDHVSPRITDPARSKMELLEQEGRGPTLFWVKWQYAMRQWETDVAEGAAKARPNPGGYTDYGDEFAKAQTNPQGVPADIYEMLSVRDLKVLLDPQWLIHGMMPEQSMGFVFGPPGCLKTFIALGMALTFATEQKIWWGRAVERHGTVLYICSEGTGSLKFRINAWERHFKISADDSPFMLIRKNINFMLGDDVFKLLRTVQAAVDQYGPVVAVFVDTVSRVLPGAEENLQKDMTIFIAACDAVRQTFGATVIGLHHTNATGGFRGSTVMPGAGDFLMEVRREPGAMSGSIYARKVKDAEDGWEQSFKVVEISIPGVVLRTSLVVDSAAAPEQRESPVKDKASFDIREQILRSLDRAWCEGDPWSHAKNSPRYGVNIIMNNWYLDRHAAKSMLDVWLAKEIIKEDTLSTKLRRKGYRKLLDL